MLTVADAVIHHQDVDGGLRAWSRLRHIVPRHAQHFRVAGGIVDRFQAAVNIQGAVENGQMILHRLDAEFHGLGNFAVVAPLGQQAQQLTLPAGEGGDRGRMRHGAMVDQAADQRAGDPAFPGQHPLDGQLQIRKRLIFQVVPVYPRIQQAHHIRLVVVCAYDKYF